MDYSFQSSLHHEFKSIRSYSPKPLKSTRSFLARFRPLYQIDSILIAFSFDKIEPIRDRAGGFNLKNSSATQNRNFSENHSDLDLTLGDEFL